MSDVKTETVWRLVECGMLTDRAMELTMQANGVMYVVAIGCTKDKLMLADMVNVLRAADAHLRNAVGVELPPDARVYNESADLEQTQPIGKPS